MVEECAINVGFHSYFGRFRQSGHSKTPLGSAIINKIPFNPTYNLIGRLKDLYGISIALAIHSLDPSLFSRLILSLWGVLVIV